MKKRLILLSFMIIVLGSFLSVHVIVNAAKDISSIGGGVGNMCNGQYCWGSYAGYALQGMRVTLITTDGNQIGKSINITDSNYYNFLNEYINYYVVGTGCSKVQYKIGANCNVNKETKKTWSGNPWKNYNGSLGNSNLIAPLFAEFGVSLTSNLQNWNLDDIWNWADNKKVSLTDDKMTNLYKTLFDLDDDDILNLLSKLNDLWVVIEPITMLTIDGNVYLGTAYELGSLRDEYSRGTVDTVIERKLPCAAFVTGDIANKYPDAPGVTSNGYFNGKIGFVNTNDLASNVIYATFSEVCSIKNGVSWQNVLKEEYVTGQKGAGMGLIYVKDTVTEPTLDCDIVNKGIPNLSAFNKKLDNAYKTGGINAIYNLPEVKDGIKFTGGVADKYWYINECTCYGAYSAYQPNINKPQLYDQPKKIIENLFKPIPNIFTNYFDTVNEKIKDVNIINKGTTVSWDYNKYENLECGHLDCREVDFEKIDFSKLDNPKMTPEECNETYGGKFPVLYNQQKLKQCIKEYNEYNDKLYGENGIKKQCERLPLYGDQNYTEEYVKQYIDQYKECFELYNEQFGTNWTYDSYTNPKDDCPLTGDGGETPKKYNCTPKYNVGTCLDGESVFYSDSAEKLSTDEYWENCVFDDKNAYYDIDIHKVSDKNSSLTYYDKTLSSSYCEVYCTETLTTGFNSNTMNVISGQYFVWNNHSLSGSRTCKTKSIDWDKFKKDLSTAKDQNQANAIYNEMKKCYDPDIWDENIYNLNPTGILTYYYTVNGVQGIYNVNQEMDKNITYTTISNNLDCKDTTVKVGNTNQTIKQCTSVEMTKGATVQFSLPSGLYQYINKDNNISFNANQLESLKSEYLSQGKQLNYLNVGYSNLPVEFKVPEGYYGQLFGNGELSITYSDLGHKVGNNKTAVDTILGVIDSYNYGNWQCDFIVEDGLIPGDPDDPDNPDNPKGPGGIDLIYRPIDLYDPFPDIDGSGRNTGSNWCDYNTNETDCSNDNQVVYDYILNNRDVEGEEIYSKDPMYTFILTPSIIREIRNYNNQNSYTDYSGSLGDKTYDFKCNEGTGKNCISDYLSHIIDITGAKNQPGTCVDDKFRTYNDSDNFEGCRYFDSDLPIFNPPSYELPVEKPDISTH